MSVEFFLNSIALTTLPLAATSLSGPLNYIEYYGENYSHTLNPLYSRVMRLCNDILNLLQTV